MKGNASLELHLADLLNISIRVLVLTEFVKSRTQSNLIMCRVVSFLSFQVDSVAEEDRNHQGAGR